MFLDPTPAGARLLLHPAVMHLVSAAQRDASKPAPHRGPAFISASQEEMDADPLLHWQVTAATPEIETKIADLSRTHDQTVREVLAAATPAADPAGYAELDLTEEQAFAFAMWANRVYTRMRSEEISAADIGAAQGLESMIDAALGEAPEDTGSQMNPATMLFAALAEALVTVAATPAP